MRKAIVVVFVLYLLTGCASFMDVKYEYNLKYNKSGKSKYFWMPIPHNIDTKSLFWNQIQDAVNRNLNAKGYKQKADQPDFKVAVHRTTKKGKYLVPESEYNTGNWRSMYFTHRMCPEPPIPDYYEAQTIIISFIDSKSKEMFWRGTAIPELDKLDSNEDIVKMINKAVDAILIKFPNEGYPWDR